MSRRVPLMLQVVTGDPRPINRQIVDGVRRLIASGELPVGAALPSVRGLAQQLAVNPNTVAKAYTELTTEGWLDARAGLGLFVAIPRQRLSDDERARRLDDAVQRFAGDIIGLDYPASTVLDRVAVELDLCLPKKSA
ncbi:GntR family transcriptional regulator [Massilia eurypsychrophila]|jgi:GntR family transcriptional regulator|uniref:GntR family transcriptional regulator n=1 Tax=Massilia eurypsychrophila TaxID=1485217 RepID=A0A2G8T8X5_9BURK|nr:GntR family transcriptional regulator [Massilia eurypsychrophila]PIL42423.1 GntR family transcriptional regulator [Massilia eurypsychrophila]